MKERAQLSWASTKWMGRARERETVCPPQVTSTVPSAAEMRLAVNSPSGVTEPMSPVTDQAARVSSSTALKPFHVPLTWSWTLSPGWADREVREPVSPSRDTVRVSRASVI